MTQELKSKGFGNYLVEKGIISEEQLNKAIEYQYENAGKRLGEILYEVNILVEEEALRQLADYMNVEYIVLDGKVIPLKTGKIFDSKTMIENLFAPFNLEENVLSIAISNIKDFELRERIECIARGYIVKYYLCLPDMIREFIKRSLEHGDTLAIFRGKKVKFGEYLVGKGLATKEQIRQVLKYQEKYLNKRIGELICEMGILGHEETLKELAAYLQKEYESLSSRIPDPGMKELFEPSYMERNNFVPFEKEKSLIKIALNNIYDFELIEMIEERLARGNLEAKFYISTVEAIQEFIRKMKN